MVLKLASNANDSIQHSHCSARSLMRRHAFGTVGLRKSFKDLGLTSEEASASRAGSWVFGTASASFTAYDEVTVTGACIVV